MGSKPEQNKLEDVFTPHLDQCLLEMMRERNVPGCSIAIIRKVDEGYDELIKVYGEARAGREVSSRTRFPIASNTKLFTVFALAKLLEEHGFTFGNRVKDIIPEFKLVDKIAEESCTVGDLCGHVSGIPGYNLGYTKHQSKFDIFKLFGELRPTTSLQHENGFQYSNMGYDVLGYIIEHLSGDTYRNYLQKNIFDPLEMRSAGFLPDENTAIAQRCDEHEYTGKGEPQEVDLDLLGNAAWEASGGLIASAEDMVKWMKSFPILPGYEYASTPQSIDPSWGQIWNYPYSSSVATYGAGLYQLEYNDKVIQEHWGYISGYRSVVLWIEEAGVGLTVMTNGGGGEDVINLIKMVTLDRFTGGGEIRAEEWVKRINAERKIKKARITSQFPAIQSISITPCPTRPTVGTFTCPGFPNFELDENSYKDTRPECVVIPFRPQLYGNLKPILTYMGVNEDINKPEIASFEGCFEFRMKGQNKIVYGFPFKLEVDRTGAGAGDQLRVYGLSDTGYGVDIMEHPAIFRRV